MIPIDDCYGTNEEGRHYLIKNERYVAYQRLYHFLFDFGYVSKDCDYVIDYKEDGNGTILFCLDFNAMYEKHPLLKNYNNISLSEHTKSLIEDVLL